MRRHVTFYAIVVSVIVLGGVALSLPATPVFAAQGPPGENDASSGSDAGNSPENALAIGGARRMWSANLTPPGTDADWYRMQPAGAFCAVVDATTNAPGQVTLAASTTRDPSVSRQADPHKPTRLALAGTGGRSALFGLEPPAMMLLAASETHPSPGRYTFAMSTVGYADLDPQDDGESPEAGDTLATGAALPADCSAGRVGGNADALDTYFFDGGDRRLAISFAIARGPGVSARVVTPTGATYATIQNGDAVEVWASEPGRWSVVVGSAPAAPLLPARMATLGLLASGAQSDAESTEYVIGVTSGPGEPQPCRPTCAG